MNEIQCIRVAIPGHGLQVVGPHGNMWGEAGRDARCVLLAGAGRCVIVAGAKALLSHIEP